MRDPGRGLVGQVGRYGLVGLFNTALGFGVIAALEFGLGLSPYLANAGGYAAGFAAGYLLTRVFVFKARDKVGASTVRYLIAVAVCYGLNLAVLTLGRTILPRTNLFQLFAQLCAMGTYTVALFLASRYFVFRGATS